MFRWIDLAAVLGVAVVVLLPKASVTARPAFVGDPIVTDRLAQLEDERARRPDDPAAAADLADELLVEGRADWAIMALSRFASGNDWRVHLVLATARADRLETTLAVDETRRVGEICKTDPTCAPWTMVKVELLRRAMQTLVDQHIDPAKEPIRARQEVAKVLHLGHYTGSTAKPAK